MTEINKRRNRSIVITMMIIISAIVAITSVIFTFVLIDYRIEDLIDKSDNTLLMAAELSREIVGSDYHDKIDNEFSVTNEQFNKIVAKNDDLCRRLQLQYLWSVLVIGDRIVFTSATHSDLTKPHSSCATFFETHSDPDAFTAAIHAGLKPSFSTFENQWGKGRMVLVPRKDVRGRTYIFGASVQLTEFNEIIYRSIGTSIGIGLAVMLSGLLLALILSRLITLPITKLTKAANIMATGNLDIALEPTKTHELQSLSAALDQMRQGIQNHISALRESEEKYRSLHHSMMDAFVSVDMEGRIIDYNDSYLNMLGYTPEEISKLTYKDITPEKWHKLETAIIENQVISNGYSDIYEKEYRRKDGTVFPVELRATLLRDAQGAPMSMWAIARDISERRQAEDSLRRRDSKYRELVEHAQDGIFTITVQGQFILVNTKFCQMLGYTLEECLRINILDTYPDDMRPVGTKRLADLQSGQVLLFERPMKRQDGGIVLVEAIAWKDNDGGVQAIVRDITDRKQAEAEKAALEAQNRQLQKSESLGRMAASIAHHFNNQLGAVIGNLEMAMDELPQGASTHQTLTKAMQSAWKAADMSGLMLTYLGQTHDKRESLDFSYSCRKILPLIKTALPGNVVMETDFPLPRPIIMANTGEIQQMLTNLITNAREAIGNDKGTISLSVKTVSPIDIPTQNRFPVDWESLDKTFACLEVTDTGCGIEDKDIEKLFDPFYTTKFTGRGMSLAVVMGLVTSYKGVITVDSKPGRGSTFRLFFPVSEEAMRQPQMAENDREVTSCSPSSRKFKEGGMVMVVEDEEILRDMAAAMLGSSGFTVLKAKDGIEALEIFRQHQSEIKFVLSDLTMPRMNGWETLNALRKLQPGIPVILASGYDKAHVMEGDHPEMPQAFLAKPYNLKAMRNAISQVLENKKK